PLTLSLVVLVYRRPPISALFPYTTLFRSVVGERLQVVHGRVWFTSTATPTGEGRERDPHVGVPARVRGVVHIAALSLQDEAQGTDRKSTRLNSSHVKISYAVFCLKKKKK